MKRTNTVSVTFNDQEIAELDRRVAAYGSSRAAVLRHFVTMAALEHSVPAKSDSIESEKRG